MSIVVLSWDQPALTERCVESLRTNTTVDYELIIVDNGSHVKTARLVASLADRAILNDTNLGFSAGMNQGLAVAEGKYVVFLNNDTEVPPGWASLLAATAARFPNAAIVAPAVTAGGYPHTVRRQPSCQVYSFPAFRSWPSGILYWMPTHTAVALGGWSDEYELAGAEDIDLCFKAWVNACDVVMDERVLVKHVGKGTAAAKLGDYLGLWKRNRGVFLDKWTGAAPDAPRLPSCDPLSYHFNLRQAQRAAWRMKYYFMVRDRLPVVARALSVGRRMRLRRIARHARSYNESPRDNDRAQ